jgi:hypothetical protein
MTRPISSGLLLLLLVAAPAAWAQAPDAPVKPEEPSLDFELLEPAPAADAARAVDPKLEQAVGRRRTMLKVHQALGFALAASMASTVVVGQLHFDDRYRGGGDTGRYRLMHKGLVLSTTGLFTAVGLLGLLAPSPFKQGLRWDTSTLHRICMALATVGMVTQMTLGLVTKQHEGKLSQVGLARAHQAAGYATMGALSVGVVTLFF